MTKILQKQDYHLWGKVETCSMMEKEKENIGGEEDLNEREAHIGDKIRKLRKQRGWTQEELAHRSDIDASYLGQIERGKTRSPTIRIIGKIADALSVDSCLLLEEEEDRLLKDERKAADSNILELITLELSGRSRRELMVYYKIVKLLRELTR